METQTATGLGEKVPGTYCSRTYGGFANSESSRAELLKLIESLKRDGMKFKEAPFYRAGYDSPFKLTNRRNEVWLIKDEE